MAKVAEASVVYFSGGNPAYPGRHARRHAVLVGAVAGEWNEASRTSAAARASRAWATRPRTATASGSDDGFWQPGLGVFHGVWFGPHWDALDGYVPGLSDFIVSSVPRGDTLFAIDERTGRGG